MSRISKIINKSRLILSDKDKTRWSDDDLMSIFNEGLNHFVLHSKSLKLRSYILIEDLVGMYDMSPYSTSIERVEYMAKVLIGKMAKEMDRIDSTWTDTEGTEPKYVIFDNYENSIFRLYPKAPSGVATSSITQNSLYGGLIDIEITDDLFQIPQTDIIEQNLYKYILVYYIGKPTELAIDSIDSLIDLNEGYDTAITSYIVGQCLMFDQDAISRELSKEQLGIYESYLAKAIKKESINNNTFTQYTTQYRKL